MKLCVEELEPRFMPDVNPLDLRDPQSAANAAAVLLVQQQQVNMSYNGFVAMSPAQQAALLQQSPNYLTNLTTQINGINADLTTIRNTYGQQVIDLAAGIAFPPPPQGAMP